MSTTPATALQALTREQFWQHHIDQWHRSELSKMAYCRTQDLAYHQFLYWSDKPRRRDDSKPNRSSGFVNVALVQPSVEVADVSSVTLTLELPGGITVKNISASTVPLVAQLVRSL